MLPVPVLMMAAAMFKTNARSVGHAEEDCAIGCAQLKVHGVEYRIDISGVNNDVISVRQRDEFETTDWRAIDGTLYDAYEVIQFVDEAGYLA